MAFDETLDLDRSWRIGEGAFREICGLIRRHGCTTMVEFGSGASTVRLALEFPELSILSFEHEPSFFEETRQALEARGLGGRVTLRKLPLRYVWLQGRPFHTYALPALAGPYDLILIDGPPCTTRRGREAALYYSFEALRVGGLVVLDDMGRADEQVILANWLRAYPGAFAVETLAVDHGLAVLQKVREVPGPRPTLGPTLDTFATTIPQLFGVLKQRLRRVFGG